MRAMLLIILSCLCLAVSPSASAESACTPIPNLPPGYHAEVCDSQSSHATCLWADTNSPLSTPTHSGACVHGVPDVGLTAWPQQGGGVVIAGRVQWDHGQGCLEVYVTAAGQQVNPCV